MAKKKQVKKIKSKKLEDRIAPGMVGGGLVDPGMMDVVDADGGQDSGVQENFESTQAEHLESDGPSEGQYLDEANSQHSEPVNSEYNGDENPYNEGSDEYSEGNNYDEFSSNEGPTEYNEEPPAWQEADWVTMQADGSADIFPPEGVTIDEGVANFSVEAANEELPISEDMTFNEDGSITHELPEGSEYLSESNQLLLPAESVPLDEIPEQFEAHTNPDGSIMVNLPPEGVTVDMETNSINFDNYWANELAPEHVEITPEGSVNIQLPEEGIEYNDDGSIHMSAEAAEFMSEPPPEYYIESDYAEYNADGSVSITPPEGVNIDGGICELDYNLANEHLDFPEEFELNQDGSANYQLPENCEYNESVNCLTFPEGEMNINEVPEGIDAHMNPDGTTSVMLQDGLEYDGQNHSVHLSNEFVNEVTPDSMHISPDGQVQIALPEGTEFYDDGSFTIPSEAVDFYEGDYPEYVDSCEWANYDNVDGGYHCHPPEGIHVDGEQGQFNCPNDMIDEHLPVDEHIEFNADGTMDVKVPEGTQYDANLNALTFPAGEVHLDEIPEQVNPVVNEDGSISIQLQDGMEFNTDNGSIHLDNYWANELTPEPVHYEMDGSLKVDLPYDCEYHDDGSFNIPEHCTDFLENPDPSYCTEGPDWVTPNPDGSISLSHCEHFESYPEDGYIQMNCDYINEGFNDYIPEGTEFHSDGTMSIQVEEGTLYDSNANSLTFPEGAIHMDEIPNEIKADFNDNGTITVHLADGMDYNAETGAVHFDNYWTNELTPGPVEFSPEGYVHVEMPHDCHYFDDGSISIPEGSCDFMDEPYPDYVNEGPDWVNDNPDGSVTVTPPEGMEVNAQEGYISCDYQTAMEQFGGDLIPEEFSLNADGTATLSIPEDIKFDYNADTNSFTLTETPEHFNINEVPDFMEASYDADGNVVVNFPEGCNYDADAGGLVLSNELVNEIAPEPIEFGADGEFKINLPEDTQYFDNGFVISGESADFLDDHNEHHEGHGEYQHDQGQYEQKAS